MCFKITGICYGFQVMSSHESPDVPFTLLRTRFRIGNKWNTLGQMLLISQYLFSFLIIFKMSIECFSIFSQFY